MLLRSMAETVPSIRYVALSRVNTPVVFPRTAVLFAHNLPFHSRSKASAHSSNSLQFFRCLSVSCPASFHRTNMVCGGAEHDKVEYSAGSVESKPSQTERLKRAMKEYGAIVIVFHTCISLFTLGVSYTAVSSGIDVVGLLGKVGVGQSILESKIATGTGTFVIAYAVHKVFAPVRMATTLAATPLIARYLRRIGFLKQPMSKV